MAAVLLQGPAASLEAHGLVGFPSAGCSGRVGCCGRARSVSAAALRCRRDRSSGTGGYRCRGRIAWWCSRIARAQHGAGETTSLIRPTIWWRASSASCRQGIGHDLLSCAELSFNLCIPSYVVQQLLAEDWSDRLDQRSSKATLNDSERRSPLPSNGSTPCSSQEGNR